MALQDYVLIDTETGALLSSAIIKRDEPNNFPLKNQAEVLLVIQRPPTFNPATQVLEQNNRAEPWPFVFGTT